MKEHKLTLRVTTQILEGAKSYAFEQGTSVTRLVTAYLQRVGLERPGLASAPITQRLTGVLPLGRSSTRTDSAGGPVDEEYDRG